MILQEKRWASWLFLWLLMIGTALAQQKQDSADESTVQTAVVLSKVETGNLSLNDFPKDLGEDFLGLFSKENLPSLVVGVGATAASLAADGLTILSLFDLIANEMRMSFVNNPDFAGYTAVTPQQSLFEMNPPFEELAGAARQTAIDSMKMRFDVPDAAPTERLTRILWHQIKGWDAAIRKSRRPSSLHCPLISRMKIEKAGQISERQISGGQYPPPSVKAGLRESREGRVENKNGTPLLCGLVFFEFQFAREHRWTHRALQLNCVDRRVKTEKASSKRLTRFANCGLNQHRKAESLDARRLER